MDWANLNFLFVLPGLIHVRRVGILSHVLIEPCGLILRDGVVLQCIQMLNTDLQELVAHGRQIFIYTK